MAPLWNHTVSWKRNSLGVSIYISESLSREENKFKLLCAKQTYHSVIFGNCLRRKMRHWQNEERPDGYCVSSLRSDCYPHPDRYHFCFPYCDFTLAVDDFPILQFNRLFSFFFFFYPSHTHLWRSSSNLIFSKTLYWIP